MKNRNLYIAWGVFYIFCTVLGFIPAKEGGFFALSMLLSFGFFVPPSILLYRSVKRADWGVVRLIRGICAVSLGTTVVFMVLNILSVGASTAVGNMLYYLLIVVSSPMVCIRIQGISLFLWAVLLIVCIQELKKHKSNDK